MNIRHSGRLWGWLRATFLEVFANAVILLVAMGALGREAIGRLREPATTVGMTIKAGLGISTRAAFLHMDCRQRRQVLANSDMFASLAGFNQLLSVRTEVAFQERF